MNHSLLRSLPEVQARLAEATLVALFLDFDGTLTPIVPDPAAPVLDNGTRETLDKLAQSERVILSFVSGRSIQDLHSRIQVKGAIFAGNHGLEICGRQITFLEPTAAASQDALRELCARLSEDLRPIKGVLVEFKGLTASVHYRSVEEPAIPLVKAAVRTAIVPFEKSFRLTEGKKVMEVLPRTDWNKGKAVQWINEQLGKEGQLSICFGDDRTDEDAFRVLPEGITVRVGDYSHTSAHYHVSGPPGVHQFLQWLADRKL